jgi:hypothetical protein
MKKSKRWGEPQLDRAQFATDALFARHVEIAERVGTITQAMRAGTVSDAQLSELADLKAEMISVYDEMRRVGERILAGNPAPHLRKV